MTDEKSQGLDPTLPLDEADLEAALALPEVPQSDDARDVISRELAHVLEAGSDLALVLSGDMSRALGELPFSDGVPAAAWCVSDVSALAQLHHLFRLGGAAGAVTNTAGCTDVELEAAGLAHCEEAAIDGAVRAALSASPRYVLGRVRGFAVGDAAREALAREALVREAARLEEAGVHGFVAEGGSAAETVLALQAVREVSGRPVIATMAPGACSGDPATGMAAPEAVSRLQCDLHELACAGASALGAELGLGDLGEPLEMLALLSQREGLALCVRVANDADVADAAAEDGASAARARRARAASAAAVARALEAAAATLTAAGVRTVSLGRGFLPGDTARLVQFLRPHFASLGWRFVT